MSFEKGAAYRGWGNKKPFRILYMGTGPDKGYLKNISQHIPSLTREVEISHTKDVETVDKHLRNDPTLFYDMIILNSPDYLDIEHQKDQLRFIGYRTRKLVLDCEDWPEESGQIKEIFGNVYVGVFDHFADLRDLNNFRDLFVGEGLVTPKENSF